MFFTNSVSASLALLTIASHGGIVSAQFADYYNYTTFPAEQFSNSSKYIAEARALAEPGLYAFFAFSCLLQQSFTQYAAYATALGFVKPVEVFKGFYFIGTTDVTSWAINTGEGLLIIDTLNNPTEAADIIIPGIEAFGFTGADIKHVFVTHEHADHYGGARYLQETYGVPVIASAAAWATMGNATGGPVYDSKAMTVGEGDRLTFGNFTIDFYITPGHTNGTTSTIFKIVDLGTGETHKAGFYGGTGVPATAYAISQQITSYGRFADIAEKRGVDTLISNHQIRDSSLYNIDILNHRECNKKGNCNTSNPYVVGVKTFRRWLSVQILCTRASAARKNLSLSV